MSLKTDLNAGLAAISNQSNPPALSLDKAGRCTIPVPLPASILKVEDGLLQVEVRLSKTGKFFSLITPLALLNAEPDQALLEALLQRQFYPDQTGAASLALADTADQQALVAIYHWMLDSITPGQFTSLFQNFISAVLTLLDEVRELANQAEYILVQTNPNQFGQN